MIVLERPSGIWLIFSFEPRQKMPVLRGLELDIDFFF
jgi:hypothetical protein